MNYNLNTITTLESKNQRSCFACGSTTTSIGKRSNPKWKNCEKWYPNHDGTNNTLCHNCYMKYLANPVFRVINNPIYQPRRILFKGKRILLKEPPRTGVCSKCGRSVAKGEIKRTAIHHKKYHDEDPLKDTSELCASCHAKEHFGGGERTSARTITR